MPTFFIHLLFLFMTTSNVRFADSAYCLMKVIVSVPLIQFLFVGVVAATAAVAAAAAVGGGGGGGGAAAAAATAADDDCVVAVAAAAAAAIGGDGADASATGGVAGSLAQALVKGSKGMDMLSGVLMSLLKIVSADQVCMPACARARVCVCVVHCVWYMVCVYVCMCVCMCE